MKQAVHSPEIDANGFLLARESRHRTALLVMIVILTIVPRCFVIFGGLEMLIQFVPDDTYYYAQVGKQILAGHGSTFDGIHPTNGYHPLWLLTVLPSLAVVENRVLLTEILMCLSTTMILLSAFFLYFSLRILVPRRFWLQMAGVAIYLLNPQILFASVNGLETGLTNLIFGALIYAILSRNEEITNSFKTETLLGALIALLFLSRTDTVFYVAPLFLWLFLQNPGKELLKTCLRTGVIAVVITLPWLIWNYTIFGSFIQDSGTAVPYRLHQNFLLAGQTDRDLMFRSIRIFLRFMREELEANLGFRNYFYILILCSGYFLLSRWNQMDLRWKSHVRLLLYLLAGGLGLCVVHSGVRWFPREWYFSQLIFVTVMLVITALAHFASAHLRNEPGAEKHSRLHWRSVSGHGLAIVLIVLAATASYKFLQTPPYPHQKQMLSAAELLKKNTEKGDIAASFNSGIYSFFSQRTVVNLDGVMNSDAYAAIRKRALLEFMKNARIHIYLDYHPILLNQHRHFLGSIDGQATFTKIGEIPKQGELGWESWPIEIFRIRWPDEIEGPVAE